jgi:hypothetical protein
MTDPEAALAWAEALVEGRSNPQVKTLAAEVRRLQAAHTMQVGLLEACEDLGVQLESAKRRQQQAEADRDSAVALYGVERADRQQAEAEVRRLHADVASYGDGHLCHPTRSMASDSGGVCAHCGRTLHARGDYDDDLAKAEAAHAALREQRKQDAIFFFEAGHQSGHDDCQRGDGERFDEAWARREP